MMIRAFAVAAPLCFIAGLAMAAPISCSELPKAEHFVATRLKPGPNTRAAERHLAAARHAKSPAECSKELGLVDLYARRSLAADRQHH